MDIGFEQRLVHLDLPRVGAQVAIGDEHVHVAPRQLRRDGLAGRVLQEHQVPGHPEGDVQEAVVDALDLHRHLPPVDLHERTAITRHAQHTMSPIPAQRTDHKSPRVLYHNAPSLPMGKLKFN